MEDIVGIRKNSPKKIDKTGKRTVLFSTNRNIQTIKERTFLSGESIVRYNKSASLRRKGRERDLWKSEIKNKGW